MLITYLGYIVAIIIWVNSSYTSDRSLVKHIGEKRYYIWDEFPGQCLQLWLLSCVLMLLCLCVSLIDRASSDRVLGGLEPCGWDSYGWDSNGSAQLASLPWLA